ncbi:SH3 domain-containing protein [Leptolyngbya sp. FACHB-16]|uniref:SH3 domain-containing protein n=1 Tax=unclassified Leptolyngbya TaxID=2650499 RepID=UPI001681EE43|nr:SH3 domain-containing protein [Leptolyngbya sp. FACHB-16]MBD2156174.1 SH3 domain-containing protein [Leptolyngbya sp. FACHB-16]
MVLLEPITDSGDLNLTLITLETNEETSVVINCTDLKQNGDRALLQIGPPDGLEETVGDYIDWFSASFRHFCDEWNGSPASPQATAPSPSVSPQTRPLPETPAVLTSETPDAKINIRNGPSTAARASAYGYAGDAIVLLAEAQDEQNATWYQVRFNKSKHVGWVREDFVTTELGRSPSPTTGSDITSLSETPAELTSDTPGSRINVRSGPSTSASSSAYGFAGDRVVLLAETQDNRNSTWYQVRFQESRHVGWVREDFVTIDRTRPSSISTP